MFNSILLLCFIYHLSVIVNKPIPFASCAISNPYQIHIWAIYGSRTTPDASIGLVPYQTHIKSISGPYMGYPPFPQLDFGLGACVFSAVLLPLEPTIPFSHCSAVSHSKSRDFRLYEPAILFSTWSAVSHSKTRDFRFP